MLTTKRIVAMGIGLRQRVRTILVAVGTAIVIAAGPIIAAALQNQFDGNQSAQCRTPENSQQR